RAGGGPGPPRGGDRPAPGGEPVRPCAGEDRGADRVKGVSFSPMRIRAAAGLFLFLALLVGAPLRASVSPPAKDDEFKEEIDVRISTIVLRVVDAQGEPIRGLGPRDFRVRLGRREVPVVAVD